MPIYNDNMPDRRADHCEDQLPLFSTVGRGIKGDSYRVDITNPDTTRETHLEGGYWDEASKTFNTDWVSQNINGGELLYQYNLRPYTIPRTFTITFLYKRPGRREWSWTTPAIPYIWSLDPAGRPDTDPDHIVGTGVATIFVRTKHTDWLEKLQYPIDPETGQPFPREDFNAPNQGEGWTANITFGFGGDVDVPDFDDLAKILGITKNDIYNILQDNSITIDGLNVSNIIDFIKKADNRLSDHIHADLGFNNKDHTGNQAFGGYATVKAYIDAKIADLQSKLDKANNHINNLYGVIDDLIAHIYGATGTTVTSGQPSTSMADGSYRKITWNPDQKIPQGNINVLSSNTSKAILTHSGESTGDVKAS